MSLLGSPPTNAVDRLDIDKRGRPSLASVDSGWRNFFNGLYLICLGTSQSGKTANRPSDGLWVGRPYFDTTLGFPVWYNGVTWVNSAGAPA